MSVAHAEVVAAFLYFLGRRPNPEKPPEFASKVDLYRTILTSPEFRAASRSKKNSLGWPLNQNFISRHARAIYCPIGKNGCTFLKRQMVLSSDIEYRDQIATNDVHQLTDHVRTGMQLSDYSEAEVADFLQSPDYIRFAVIRAPMERLISAYMEKFVMGRMSPPNWAHTKPVVWHVQKAAGLEAPDMDLGITFREFATFVVSRPPGQLDAHWRPQHLYLEGVRWDQLYEMSELSDITDMLEARSGRELPRKAVNVSGKLGRTFREGSADLLPGQIAEMPPLSIESYLDAGLQDAIETYYAADSRLLNEKRRSALPGAAQ